MTTANSVQAARLVSHDRPIEVADSVLGQPGLDEVVVEMAYSGVNPIDRYLAIGRVAPDAPVPRTLGVEGVGTYQGRWVLVQGHGLASERDGLWAQAAVVPRAAMLEVPLGVDPVKAAAMGVAGATAWRTVTDIAAVGPSDRVLVLGASGGVGAMIVSLVRSIGAQVWGQTGSRAKASAVESGGAERAVVAGSPAELVAAAGALRPTVVFDPLGGDYTGAAITLLQAHGRLVLFGTSADSDGTVPLQALYRKGLSVFGYGGLIEPVEAIRVAIAGALEAVAEGRMDVRIDEIVPLTRANDALDRLERRQVSGKIILSLGTPSAAG